MKTKDCLVVALGSILLAVALFSGNMESIADDGFYVIPVTNPNIKILGENTAIGIGALQANTTGNFNTASGYQALYSNTTGSYNTASGDQALYSNTGGLYNTANGYQALYSNWGGGYNTANGYRALYSNTSSYNTASGFGALQSNTTGHHNTASGHGALGYNTTGDGNTASGFWALLNNTTGNYNTALGFEAGSYAPSPFTHCTGSYNIYIGDSVGPLTTNESNTIRIGNSQTRAFIKGIYGTLVSGGIAVYVNSSGQLGTSTSSRQFKEDIQDMGNASRGLMQLRPVTFHFKSEYVDGPRTLQYGLIAEEVAQVYPDLVQYDPKTGEPQTVYYHLVNAMLLNEVQKQHHHIFAQEEKISKLKEQLAEMSDLKERLSKLEALLSKQLFQREERVVRTNQTPTPES